MYYLINVFAFDVLTVISNKYVNLNFVIAVLFKRTIGLLDSHRYSHLSRVAFSILAPLSHRAI